MLGWRGFLGVRGGVGAHAESLLGESGLIGQLKKQLAERMLSAELAGGWSYW